MSTDVTRTDLPCIATEREPDYVDLHAAHVYRRDRAERMAEEEWAAEPTREIRIEV